ncbi:MFS transporter [Kocuria sp. M1R5S2]|uniref:MFS transporter n=1 Tax=Kocuria rhizosphaerae TaxID=3376285 RepID=UPI0037ADA94D
MRGSSRTGPGHGARRIAYPALLATTALGTMSSNVINAPLYVIQQDLGMTAQQSVMAVSAFTIAMATTVPLAGWLGERLGVKAFLISALGVMVLAELVAASAAGTETLVLARVVQGAACSAFPPCVQTALVTTWPERTARTMGAWASAIGVGQAVGPPFGGVITEALGWRWVFLVHAALLLVLMALLAACMPAIGRRRPPMHVSAMLWLIVGGGSTATAVLLAGQTGPWPWVGLLAVSAGLGWWMFVRLSRRRVRLAAGHDGAPRALLDPALLREPAYLTAAAGAGLAMGSMAVAVVAMPLFLGSDLDLGPAQIGMVVFALAFAMTAAGPIASRTGRRSGSRVQLRRGVVILVVATPVVAVAMVSSRLGVDRWVVVTLVVLGLVLAGTGIAFAQSAAATELVLSPAGRSGTAVGIHNMIRFLSMAVGYTGVALAWASGTSLLLFPAIAALALGLFAVLRTGRRPVPCRPH